ncbi:hypothetical protein NDU88_005456 [Pleurodeles waltl]|uniref:Uncharacterized protein n=1 Tax=Pleurodeles waltl TaxID=8319 RepID=A0AAV7QFC5_PLEWA|nr:hypothetical protein NDU88_005456 [Pleurodeles waltl]
MAYYANDEEQYEELQKMPLEHQMEERLVEAQGHHVQDSAWGPELGSVETQVNLANQTLAYVRGAVQQALRMWKETYHHAWAATLSEEAQCIKLYRM